MGIPKNTLKTYNNLVHKTLRKILFLFFVFVFVGLGVLLVTQTQGLVIDWQNFKFVKTGGIYVRSFPANASILINGKTEQRSTSLWNAGTLIKDLFPKTYEVTLGGDDRVLWKKKFEVLPGMVASANNIRLFEKNPEEKPLSTRFVDDFWVTNAGIIEKSGEKLYLGETLVRGTTVLVAEAEQNSIVTQDAQKNVFFIDVTNPATAVNVKEMFAAQLKTNKITGNLKITNIFLHPFSPNTLVLQADKTVFLLDTKKIALEKIMQSTTSAVFAKARNELFFFGNGRVITYNLLLGKNTVFTVPGTVPKSVLATRSGDIFFLTDEKNVITFFDRRNASSSIVGTHAIKTALSPDESKLLIAHENGSFSIFYLEEDTGDVKIPQYAIKTLPGRFDIGNGAENLLWLPSFPGYFAFLEKSTLVFAETDTRIPQNSYRLFLGTKKADATGKFRILRNDGTLSLVNFKF